MKTLTKDALLVAPRQEIIDSYLSLQDMLHTNMQKHAAKIQEFELQLDWLKRQIFGSKSERFVPDDDLQTALDLGIAPGGSQNASTENINYTRRKQKKAEEKTGHGRGRQDRIAHVDVGCCDCV